MRNVSNKDSGKGWKRYSTPSSLSSSIDLQNALLTISDWEPGGHFAMEPEGETTDFLP